jgi:hypothetical protein
MYSYLLTEYATREKMSALLQRNVQTSWNRTYAKDIWFVWFVA